MVDEKAGAITTLGVVALVAILDLMGMVPAGLSLVVGLLAVVVLLVIGVLVLGEIRDGART